LATPAQRRRNTADISAADGALMKRRPAGVAFSHGIHIRKLAAKGATRRSGPLVRASQPVLAASPFAAFPRPSVAEVTRLHIALAKHYGERRQSKRGTQRGTQRGPEILDTVVGTILSQNTTNINSYRAFRQLKQRFPTWDAVRTARPAAVATAIKCGGLAPKKTQWIQQILRTVYTECKQTTMEHLRAESKQGVHAQLERFQGVGKKTAAIINLFEVGHPDMAVDTHVFRYALQLGWVPTDEERQAHNKLSEARPWPAVTRDSVYEHLDACFPDRLKYSMHLILTDTVGGLPVHCGARNQLGFDGHRVTIDGEPLHAVIKRDSQ